MFSPDTNSYGYQPQYSVCLTMLLRLFLIIFCQAFLSYCHWSQPLPSLPSFLCRVPVIVSLATGICVSDFHSSSLSYCHWSQLLDFLISLRWNCHAVTVSLIIALRFSHFFPEATVTVSLITTHRFPIFFLKPLSQCHWLLPLDFLFFSKASVTVSLITALPNLT